MCVRVCVCACVCMRARVYACMYIRYVIIQAVKSMWFSRGIVLFHLVGGVCVQECVCKSVFVCVEIAWNNCLYACMYICRQRGALL